MCRGWSSGFGLSGVCNRGPIRGFLRWLTSCFQPQCLWTSPPRRLCIAEKQILLQLLGAGGTIVFSVPRGRGLSQSYSGSEVVTVALRSYVTTPIDGAILDHIDSARLMNEVIPVFSFSNTSTKRGSLTRHRI